MAWTDEQIELLKGMHADGFTLREKAKKLSVCADTVVQKQKILGLRSRGEGWTEERVERLKELWGNGLSSNRIADELGDTTTDAVATKAYRIGLARRTAGPSNRMKHSNWGLALHRHKSVDLSSGNVRPIKRTVESCNAEPIARNTDETMRAVTQLTSSMCRWPAGDPMDRGFHFCGRSKSFMDPYCETHMCIAYNPLARKANIREE